MKWEAELTRVLVKRPTYEIIIEKNLSSHSVLSGYHWANQESRSRRASHANLVTLRLPRPNECVTASSYDPEDSWSAGGGREGLAVVNFLPDRSANPRRRSAPFDLRSSTRARQPRRFFFRCVLHPHSVSLAPLRAQ